RHSSLSLSRPCHHRHLHSFPTRRSSDLDDSGWAPVRCDIGSHTWTAPPSGRPRDCTGDYGSTLGIGPHGGLFGCASDAIGPSAVDRKSTRLNSSHSQISYAVFCLKKKKK